MAPREAWQLVPNVQAGVPPSKLLWKGLLWVRILEDFFL